jgi:hypothetical protein
MPADGTITAIFCPGGFGNPFWQLTRKDIPAPARAEAENFSIWPNPDGRIGANHRRCWESAGLPWSFRRKADKSISVQRWIVVAHIIICKPFRRALSARGACKPHRQEDPSGVGHCGGCCLRAQ